MIWRLAICFCVCLQFGCGDSPTAPTTTDTTTTATTTTTTTAAEPTVTEQFTVVVAVGGFRFYSFTTSTYGTINVTLNSVTGTYIPATVMVNLGIGQPSGTDCVTTSSLVTAAGTSVQLTGAFAAGVYCVKVTDIGNFYGPASATVTVAYP